VECFRSWTHLLFSARVRVARGVQGPKYSVQHQWRIKVARGSLTVIQAGVLQSKLWLGQDPGP